MPYSVSSSFEIFRKQLVDLDPSDTSTARNSRDYLFNNLKALHDRDADCPSMYAHVPYGSFARRTKIRPLDDIDLLTLMPGGGVSLIQASSGQYAYRLKIKDRYYPLAQFDDGAGYVNSIKLLNQIKKSLGQIANYRKADVKRNQVAVVLDLTSYTWVFDIVPAIPVQSYDGSTTLHYLIPDGKGEWMRTDPRKDSENIARVNKLHNGLFLPVARLLKYWNNRVHKPVLSNYYFETICLKVFDNSLEAIGSVASGIERFFRLAPIYLSSPCYDPKGLGPPLDASVPSETKQSVKAAMNEAHGHASVASRFDAAGRVEAAVNSWKRVFGSSFPSYG